MAEGHKHPPYLLIWFYLFVLTVLEVGVTFLPIPKILIYVLLMGFALSKALLVALYFMHLRFERRTFALIVSSPIILALILVALLIPDVGLKS